MALLLLVGLYGFILALTGFKDSWQLAFSGEHSALLVDHILDTALATPLSSLLAGVVITSMIQSSSATIALAVATVASGAITNAESVYLLMGANIGTTVTNSIVGLAHAHQPETFRKLVPAVVVDDMFKLLNVSLFFSLEMATGCLHRLSLATVDAFESVQIGSAALHGFPDILDILTEPVSRRVFAVVGSLPLDIGGRALVCGVLFFALLVFALGLMRSALDHYLEDTGQRMVQRVLGGAATSFAIGFALCWMLQSSSVTISLILPLLAHTSLTLETVYRFSVGAALATTCDAGQLLSYLTFGPVGLATGLVHIYLNLFGALIFLLVPGLRQLPAVLAENLAAIIGRTRHAPAVLALYVVGLFFALPMGVIVGLRVIGSP